MSHHESQTLWGRESSCAVGCGVVTPYTPVILPPPHLGPVRYRIRNALTQLLLHLVNFILGLDQGLLIARQGSGLGG